MTGQAQTYPEQRASWQRWLGYLPWLLIPLLVWWSLRHVQVQQLSVILGRIPAIQIAGLLALNVIVVLSFSGRWWILLRGLGYRVPFGWLTLHRLASFGWSYFTPGPQFGGEPVQAYLASQRHAVPLTTSAASVGLDRLLELIINFSMLAAGVAWTLRSGLIGGRAGMWAAVAAAGLLTLPLMFLGALWRGHRPVSWLLGQIKSERLTTLITGIAQSETHASVLIRKKPAVIAGALAASLFSWALMILEYGLAIRIVGLNLNVTQIIMAMTATRVALLAPLPGGLGTLEAGQVAVFEVMGLDPAAGLALVLIIRARDVLFGAVGLWWSSTAIKLWNPNTEFAIFGRPMNTLNVTRQTTARIPTSFGEFELTLYTNSVDNKEHMALWLGDVQQREDVLVRVHSECFTGDVLGSRRCDCGEQLENAMQLVAAEGTGVIVYLRQEGRGIGLLDKLRAYNLQDDGYDTVEANLMLGHEPDERDYSIAACIMNDLGIRSARLMTNNPAKIEALNELGIPITDRVPLLGTVNTDNAHYLLTKVNRMDHMLDADNLTKLISRPNGSGNGHH